MAIVFAPTPRTPARRCNTERRSEPRGSGPRRSRCSNRLRSLTPVTRRFLPVMGERWQEKYDIDQNFNRDRPYWPIKTVAVLETSVARHENLQQEMSDIVVLINEEISVQAEI